MGRHGLDSSGLGLGQVIACCEHGNEQLIHQPTNALNKIQFIMSIKLLHILAPGCLPQGILEHVNLGITLPFLECLHC
jgi:hypothetical protein